MAPAKRRNAAAEEYIEYQPETRSQKRRITNSAGMSSGRGIQKALAQEIRADRAHKSSQNPKGMNIFHFLK